MSGISRIEYIEDKIEDIEVKIKYFEGFTDSILNRLNEIEEHIRDKHIHISFKNKEK